MVEFYEGGWRTDAAHPITRITHNATQSRIYMLNSTELVDGPPANYIVTVDGKALAWPMLEGSGVFVEGKDLHVKQTTAGSAGIPVTWRAILQPPTEAVQVQWRALTEGGRTTILSLQQPREFVVELFQRIPGCPNATMRVFVDDQPVKDVQGNDLVFFEGSSLLSYGKTVAVSVAADCPDGKQITGNIKLKAG